MISNTTEIDGIRASIVQIDQNDISRVCKKSPDATTDVYIAATALTQELPVVTANVDHFERVDDVRVVDWDTL